MPKARELPNSLKPLARRQAVDVRHTHFARDTEALVARMREALGNEVAGPAWWRVGAVAGVTAMAVLLLGLWAATTFVQNRGVHQAEMKWEEERRTIAAEANRKVEQAEQQRLATLNAAEQERQRTAGEAEAKRKADEAEHQRLGGC